MTARSVIDNFNEYYPNRFILKMDISDLYHVIVIDTYNKYNKICSFIGYDGVAIYVENEIKAYLLKENRNDQLIKLGIE